MNTFLTKYNQHFESSSSATPQWISFYKTACKFFRRILKDTAEKILMFNGHFYFSGFLTVKNTAKIYYFSISDVRFGLERGLLIRTAQHYKDYTGGPNHFIPIDTDFVENLITYLN